MDPVDPVAHDTSPDGMTRTNALNLEAWWRYQVPQWDGAISDDPDLFVFASGIPVAFFNGVCRATLDADRADERIAFARDWLRQRSVPGTWVIGPFSRPADLGERLLAQGFAQEGETPGMGLDLLTLAPVQPLPEGVVIEQVRTPEQMRVWVETSIAGFEVPREYWDRTIPVLARLSPDDEAHLRCYLARVDGQPAGTSMLFLGAGVAGLYSIATLPPARQRGIGAALTVAPLHEARALGYHIAVLQASAMGAPIYRRLGFIEHFRYRNYGWQPT